MHYRLRDNLSCCDVDGRIIFLDIAQDRYFKLTVRLEDAVRRFQAHKDVATTLLEELAAAQILVKAPGPKARATTANIQPPTRSAIEQPATIADNHFTIAAVFEVISIIWSTHHQLKTRTLKTILDEATAYRDKKMSTLEVATSTAFEDSLLRASRRFARARRHVPIEPVCLLDSLSLLQFLARRRLPANIVFGVIPQPFAAHCWVQAGDIVLNETLSDANAHTPIRTI